MPLTTIVDVDASVFVLNFGFRIYQSKEINDAYIVVYTKGTYGNGIIIKFVK